MPQIIPIKDLKNTSEISDMCHKTEEPIYVTKNGYGDMVIMSMEIYESTMRQIAMYRDIEISEKQIEAGQVKTLIKEENMSKKHKHISAMKTTEQKAVQQSQQPQELTPQKLNRLLEKNPFAQLLGMELLEVREGYAYGRMRMDEHFTNIYGGMHGGCAYALADTLAGLAASTYGNYVTTIDGKMNYLEAVKDTGYVYGEAEVQRQGGRIGVYTVKLMDENQKVLVTADFTYYRTGQAIDQQG